MDTVHLGWTLPPRVDSEGKWRGELKNVSRRGSHFVGLGCDLFFVGNLLDWVKFAFCFGDDDGGYSVSDEVCDGTCF